MIKAISQPVRRLINKGYTAKELVALGGKFSTSGKHITFIETDPGFDFILKLSKFDFSKEDARRIAIKTRIQKTGPDIWRKLHIFALHGENLTKESIDEYIKKNVTSKIPCGECKNHWKTLLLENPIDYQLFFEWTVMIHNKVNIRLEKPVISVDEAKTIYSN